MAELRVPTLDFSALGELPKAFKDARSEASTRMTLADLGQSLQNGTVDYRKIAGQALQSGNATLGMSLLQLGEAQQKEVRAEKAAQDFTKIFSPSAAAAPASSADASSSEPRGIRNNNPLNLEASPFTQGQPGFAGSDGRFGRFETPDQGMAAADKLLEGYGRRGVNTLSGVINRWAPASDNNPVSNYVSAVSRRAGIDPNTPIDLADPTVRAKILPAMAEFENGKPVQVAALGNGMPAASAAPSAGPQVAQAGGFQAPSVQTLIGAISNPNLPSAQKDLAKTLLSEQIKVNPEIAKLEAFRRDPSLMQMALELKKAGATNVYTGDNTKKFDEELDKKAADRWGKIMEAGDAAPRKLVDIENMRAISQRLGSQGVAADAKEAFGPYAEALGININGLSDVQAYSQIVQRLAPQQRAPGSGSTSDVEFKGFLKSLPGLSQNPAARDMGLNVMEALARDEAARGEIASRLSTKEITRTQAEKELRGLPDPMTGFVAWRKANPQIYGQALKGSTDGSASPQPSRPGQAPSAGHVEGGYRFKGGDPSKQENWERQ